MKLFLTGFAQVLFVAINTLFLSRIFYLGVLLCGFTISFIWSYNVKKVVFGTIKERLIYSIGASLGGVLGLFISQQILKLI